MNRDNQITVGTLPELFGERSLQKIKDFKDPKLMPSVLGVTAVGLGGWAFVKFALPAIMAIITPVFAGILSAGLVMGSFALAKPVWKWFKAIGNKVYKAAIRYNPEVAVENKIEAYENMSQTYRAALAKIKKASADFEVSAQKAEDEILEIQERLKKNDVKLKQFRAELANLKEKQAKLEEEMKSGRLKTQKEREPYYQVLRDVTRVSKMINNILSDCDSDRMVLSSDRNLVKSHAAKANIFAKWEAFLDMGANQIEIKKRQLGTWWNTVRKEIEAAKAGREATEALQFIIRDTKGNDIDFNIATEIIMSKIDEDYAVALQNFDDLQRHVEGFDFNSEESFSELERLLNDIEVGKIETPSAIEIASPAHTLRTDELKAAGVLGSLFDK